MDKRGDPGRVQHSPGFVVWGSVLTRIQFAPTRRFSELHLLRAAQRCSLRAVTYFLVMIWCAWLAPLSATPCEEATLGGNRTYRVNSTHFVRIGVERVGEAKVDLCTPRYESASYLLNEGNANYDHCRVSVCCVNETTQPASYPSPTHNPATVRPAKAVMCLNTVQGLPSLATVLYLYDWILHHRGLGIDFFFIYVWDASAPAVQLLKDILLHNNLDTYVAWTDMRWLSDFGLYYWGQVWVQGDCAIQASVVFPGSWALLLDADEILDAPFGSSLPVLVHDLEARGFDGITFGSVPFSSTVCLPVNTVSSNSTIARALYRSNPECGDSTGPDFSRCTSHRGRRKWMVSTKNILWTVSDLLVHVLESKFIVYDASAHEYFLRHVRGIMGSDAPCSGQLKSQPDICVPRRFNGGCAAWLPWNTGMHVHWWIDQRHITGNLHKILCSEDSPPQNISC